jgi:hypothetical protein
MPGSLKHVPGLLEDEAFKIRDQVDILSEEVRVLVEEAKQASKAAIERAKKARERLERLLLVDRLATFHKGLRWSDENAPAADGHPYGVCFWVGRAWPPMRFPGG